MAKYRFVISVCCLALLAACSGGSKSGYSSLNTCENTQMSCAGARNN